MFSRLQCVLHDPRGLSLVKEKLERQLASLLLRPVQALPNHYISTQSIFATLPSELSIRSIYARQRLACPNTVYSSAAMLEPHETVLCWHHEPLLKIPTMSDPSNSNFPILAFQPYFLTSPVQLTTLHP